MGSNRVPIENQICEWHLPLLEQSKPSKKRAGEHRYNRKACSTNDTQSYRFQHFADTTMYIDDYRRKHTVANAATDYKMTEDPLRSTKHETDCHISQYIDIRVPERKICLTGLPQLKVASHHHTLRRNTNTIQDFQSDIPHLPRLKLNGMSKKIKERKYTSTKDEHRKAKCEKRKKVRLPYLKPNIDIEENYCYNFPIP